MQEYTHDNFSYVTGHVTQWGGDFQAARAYNGVVFGGCHCYFYDYANTDTYPTPTNYSQVTTSNWLNAYNENGLVKETDFEPQWAMATDGRRRVGPHARQRPLRLGCGRHGARRAPHGTSTTGSVASPASAPRDTTAPTTPTNFKVTGTNIVWTPSTDDSGVAPSYEVILNDRVIATTTKRTFRDRRLGPLLRAGDRRHWQPLGVDDRHEGLTGRAALAAPRARRLGALRTVREAAVTMCRAPLRDRERRRTLRGERRGLQALPGAQVPRRLRRLGGAVREPVRRPRRRHRVPLVGQRPPPGGARIRWRGGRGAVPQHGPAVLPVGQPARASADCRGVRAALGRRAGAQPLARRLLLACARPPRRHRADLPQRHRRRARRDPLGEGSTDSPAAC